MQFAEFNGGKNCTNVVNLQLRLHQAIVFVCGVLGQFIHQRAQYVRSSFTMKTSASDNESLKLITRLTFSGPHASHRTVRAVMARRRDMAANQHRPCWHVTRNGVGLIRGRLDDYVVPHLLVRQCSFSLSNSSASTRL